MSSKKSDARTSVGGAGTERTLKPKAAPPVAVVTARHEAETVSRNGRGFSLSELAGAQLPLSVAMQWGVQVDLRRRSTSDANVEAVKAWAAGARKDRTEGGISYVKEELAKVEKEVKEEAVKVEKEVEKEVREVEKKAKGKPRRKQPPRKKAPSKTK